MIQSTFKLTKIVKKSQSHIKYLGIRLQRIFVHFDDRVLDGTPRFFDSTLRFDRAPKNYCKNRRCTCADSDVGFVIPVAGKQGRFVVGLGTSLASLRWNLYEKTNKVVKLVNVDTDKPGNRWNDAKADVNGFLWAGEFWTRRAVRRRVTFFVFFFRFIVLNARLYHGQAPWDSKTPRATSRRDAGPCTN